jgi:hypothetical protein
MKSKTLKEVSEELGKRGIKLGVSGVRQSMNRSFEKVIKEYAKINDVELDEKTVKDLAKNLEIQDVITDILVNVN